MKAYGGQVSTIIIFIGLLFTSIASADMMPLFLQGASGNPGSDVSIKQTLDHAIVYKFSDIDLGIITEIAPSGVCNEAKTSVEIQQVLDLSEEPSSLNFCIWALLGIGLCKSGPWMKKFSITCVPQWYHNSGPYQIGHGFAVSPDILNTPPVFCYMQPVYTVEDPIPQYRLLTIVSLWRQSQFTPDAIASRGPPLRSY